MNTQNKTMNSSNTPACDANRDPLSGAPGAHPVGTGLGAVGVGAMTGAVGGAVAGPVGAVAGAVVGAVAGAVIGKAAAEAVNPSIETKYWEQTHPTRPYATNIVYQEYAPAYRYGWESFGRRTPGQTFDTVEASLGRGWDQAKGVSTLGWDKAKAATRDAWNRVELAARGPAHV